MKVRNRARIAFVLGAMTAPLLSSAQKFIEPTKEELLMTSDAKAPGASAVILDREQTVDNETFITTEHVRIKVLTEAGKQWAAVEFPYDPRYHGTPEIAGRTIHADGTVVPLAGKPEDLVKFKDRREPSEIHDPTKVAVFMMPEVEVGSIVEYQWSLAMLGKKPTTAKEKESSSLRSGSDTFSIPRWDVQGDLFVHKEHFYFNPYTRRLELNGAPNFTISLYGESRSYYLLASRLPAGAKVLVGPKYDYTLDVTDIPPVAREPDSTAARGRAYRVQFYFSPFFTAAEFWKNSIKWYSGWVKEHSGVTKPIQEAASQITAGADTAESKARKLYEAVQGLENTDFSRPSPNSSNLDEPVVDEFPKTADETWKDKSGTSNDLVMLYVSLARAAGLETYLMRTVDRSRGAFDPNYLSLNQFDSRVIHLRLDGKDIYLDPGEKLCPFGQLHWSHSLTAAVEEGGKEPVFTPPNNFKDAVSAHSADLALDPRGSVTGTLKVLMNGPEALRWRQLNLLAGSQEVQRQIGESIRAILPQGFESEIAAVQGLESVAGFVSVSAKVSGQLGVATGKGLELPGLFSITNIHPEFISERTRETAVDMHFAEQVIDDVVYHLPAGYSVSSAPQSAQLAWPDHAAFVVKTQPGDGMIEIKHISARAFVLLDPKDFSALRDYSQKVAASEQQQLVLAGTSVAAAK